MFFVFVIVRPPPHSTRTATLLHYTPLVRSRHNRHASIAEAVKLGQAARFEAGGDQYGVAARLHQMRQRLVIADPRPNPAAMPVRRRQERSEEHTSELQSLMRISYAVFCLKKKNNYPQLRPFTNLPYIT